MVYIQSVSSLTVLTIGYEGASLADFIRTLSQSAVTDVVDIRQRASSRRRGFSKTPLSHALRSAGIGYRHMRALGTPIELRRKLAVERNYPNFFASFDRYLATRHLEVEELAASMTGRIALLCYERDPACCHRSRVAAKLADLSGATVTHLLSGPPFAD